MLAIIMTCYIDVKRMLMPWLITVIFYRTVTGSN